MYYRGGKDPTERVEADAFTWGTLWWRCKYDICETSPDIYGIPIRCIVATPELSANQTYLKPKWYDVLTEWCVNAPAKQLVAPDSKGQNYAPHVALARLNPENEQEILRFVNRWGLLGLWRIYRYKDGAGLLAGDKPGPKDFGGREEHSGWFIWDELYQQRSKGLYMHSFCEPLPLFAQAVEEYQELIGQLEAGESSQEQITQAEGAFSGWLHECAHPRPVYDARRKAWQFGWECNSLLGWIYLLTFLSLVEGKMFRRCLRDNCRKFFIPTRSNAKYCSDACRNAEQQARHQAKKRGIT